LRRVEFGGAVTFRLDFGDLEQQQFDQLDFAQQFSFQMWRQSAGHG
jgi:hypothetical protein